MTQPEAIAAILAELDRARRKHPKWPEDIIHQAAIIGEEAGETLQAALDCVYAGKSMDEVYKEASHAAATAIRLLCGG